jgi:uncharacterized protein YodC (DUF2158 family)
VPEQKFKSGDQVQLKSGGPKMTIDHYTSSAHVVCHWFAGNKLETGNFQQDALQTYAEPPKPKPL